MSATIDIDDIVAASLSDVGGVRPDNQDHHGDFRHGAQGRLLIVADGMGGHRGGGHASRACVEAFSDFFSQQAGTPEDWLRRCFERANDDIWDRSREDEELKGMGTTGVALYLDEGGHAWIGWVGDSRCYRWRDGKLDLLTEDHSLVEEWVKLGVLTPEEAENHPRKSELTRAVGVAPEVEPEIRNIEIEPGDRFLLCSDGLSGVVHPRAMKVTLGGQAPEAAARTLIDRAKELGSRDNITVQVVAFGSALADADAEPAPVAAPEPVKEPEVAAPPPPPIAAPEPDPEPVRAPSPRTAAPGLSWQSVLVGVCAFAFVGAIAASYYLRTQPAPPPPRSSTDVPEERAESRPAEPEVAEVVPTPAPPAPEEPDEPTVVAETAPPPAPEEPVVDEPTPPPAPPAEEAVVAKAAPPPPPPAQQSAPAASAPAQGPRIIYVPVPEPIPTSAAFDLPPRVRAFADAWLEAAATRDYAAFTELGFPMGRDEWNLTYELWESFRLTEVDVRDAPRPDRIYLRAVLSYAFHDAKGRWRTEDEHRLVLVETPSGLRFEARWK